MVKADARGIVRFLVLVTVSAVGSAQSFVLDLPLPSQRAEITQRVGVTDITIRYHRPLAGDRKIWDVVVPYGKVWRGGANENTTIAFSDNVMIEGKPLDKGTYGLHMIPTANEWTIIFSKNTTSWGSFTYDQSEDALRVNVKPVPADMHNALTYDFDQLQPNSTVIDLEWEKLAVPLKVSVDVHSIVEADLKKQLRGLSQYTWMSWDDAANYLLAEKLKEIYIFCVISDHYPALSFQARQFLKHESNSIVQPPFVLDIFTLDTMAEMLNTPILFLSYVNRRASYQEKIYAGHELTILSYHLKQNLWFDKEYDFIQLEDDFTVHLDIAMMVRREAAPGPRTPDGILTRTKGTRIGEIVKAIESRPDPGTINLGFALLMLSEHAVVNLSKAIDGMARQSDCEALLALEPWIIGLVLRNGKVTELE